MRQRVSGDPLDPGTFFILKHLEVNDRMRLTELATCANLDVSTVSRHVAQLHRQGLLERSPDPDDGRAQLLTLSPVGRQRLHDALTHRRALLARALAGWDPEDVDHLNRLLSRFARGLEGLTPELEQV